MRLVKMPGGRRMVTIFTRESGKVGAGTAISERGKSKSALAIRPFSLSVFSIDEKRKDFLWIRSAELSESHFAVAEDEERYAEASFALEFTDRLMPEGVPDERVYDLLCEHLPLLIARKRNFRLATVGFLVKVFDALGVLPGEEELRLPMEGGFDILTIVEFIRNNPLSRLSGLTLEAAKCDAIYNFLRSFAAEHLEIGRLKSDVLRETHEGDSYGNHIGKD
jgi:DNA repair protein RecO (recombination protein O)